MIYTTSSKGKRKLSKSVTLSADATTAAVDLFTVTGAVKILDLYGIVTSKTTLTNMTDCHFNVNDATIDVPLTKSTTLTMSAAVVGSVVFKNCQAATAAGFLSGATTAIAESADYTWGDYTPVIKKSGATTTIQFIYTTSDSPIAATIDFYVEYESFAGGSLN